MVNNNLVEIHNNVSIGSEKVNSVNARDLYLKLTEGGDNSQFARWVESNLINNENLIENKDYTFSDIASKTHTVGTSEVIDKGGRPSKYSNLYITIDAAKYYDILDTKLSESKQVITTNNNTIISFSYNNLNVDIVEKGDKLFLSYLTYVKF